MIEFEVIAVASIPVAIIGAMIAALRIAIRKASVSAI
jgi:hypothetical protein